MTVFNKIRYRLSSEYRIKFLLQKYISAKSADNKFKYSVILKNYGMSISSNALIGKGLSCPHPLGIVIGERVVIGEDVTVYQNVTIGQKNGEYPQIGNGCVIYPNSVIVGGITIGDNAIIGAGSIVLNNVPPNACVAGNPATIIRFLEM